MSQDVKSFQFVESENARAMPLEQLSETFIPTRLFWKLLTRRHHILLGARGQGKTALLRMLAFEGLSALAMSDSNVRKIVDAKKIFGIYLPTKLEWVQTLYLQVGGSGLSHVDAFSLKFNLSSCMAFVSTVKACLRYYFKGEDLIVRERECCTKIARVWKLNTDTGSLDDIIDCLKQINYEWQTAVSFGRFKKEREFKICDRALERALAVFAAQAFVPLKIGIDVVSRILLLPETVTWLLCLDEAEYMLPEHQIIINSFMRVASGNLFLKVATMPFSHYTLDTDIAEAPISPGDDFEYLPMDEGAFCVPGIGDSDVQREADVEFSDNEFRFGELLFQKVVCKYCASKDSDKSTLVSTFGKSKLLDNSKDMDWSPTSNNMMLLKKHATQALIDRAKKLHEKGDVEKLKNEVGRKVRGALLLREDEEHMSGHRKSDVFSGARMIVRCADGNPRMLIRILNYFFANMGDAGKNGIKVSARKQDDTLVAVAKNFLNQIRSYQGVGLELYQAVCQIGEFMQKELYDKPLTGDLRLSVAVKDLAETDERQAKLIQAAIKFGVLKPNDLTKLNYGARANLAGNYHLSYVFAPYFRVLPRKGKQITFGGIKGALRKGKLKLNGAPRAFSRKLQQLLLDI